MDKTLTKRSFENLEIWNLSVDLFIEISDLFEKESFRKYYFRDQILRATLSVSNNIAEGFERQSDKELARFLYIAKGSCGEVRSMIHIAEKRKFIDKCEAEELRKNCVQISVKIHNLIKYLNNV